MSEFSGEERPFRASEAQARRKFKHARKFGVEGPCNRATIAQFVRAMEMHVDDRANDAVPCVFARGASKGGYPVLVYVDWRSGLAVITDLTGRYVTGYELSPDQRKALKTVGRLGGGP